MISDLVVSLDMVSTELFSDFLYECLVSYYKILETKGNLAYI